MVTRSCTQEVATRIEYDPNGVVKAKTSVAREAGTTVYLQRLFHSLPVRYREFQKNLKKVTVVVIMFTVYLFVDIHRVR